MCSEITAAKTQENLEQEKLCPKEQLDFLSTDPLFSHRLTLTAPIQIQQTAYMFQTDEWNIAARSLIEAEFVDINTNSDWRSQKTVPPAKPAPTSFYLFN